MGRDTRSVAERADRTYLMVVQRGRAIDMPKEVPKDMILTEAVSPRHVGVIVLAATAVGVVFAGTAALWLHYGTAVFFETIRTGFIACFG
jgi:hypothetical protein